MAFSACDPRRVCGGFARPKEMVGYALALGDVTDRVAAGIVVGKEVQELETTKLVTAWFWKLRAGAFSTAVAFVLC